MKKRALSGLLKLDGPLLSILSLLIAIVISGVIMAVCGYNPIEAFGAILAGSFGSQRAIVQTLTQAQQACAPYLQTAALTGTEPLFARLHALFESQDIVFN